MPLGSLRHTFSDTVADIDSLSVRTRLAGGSMSGRGAAGRRGFADVHTSAAPPSAAPSTDEKLPLRELDVDQPGSSSSSTAAARTWSQRQKSAGPRSTPADPAQSATIVETPQGSLPSGLTALQCTTAEPPRSPPRPLCVIDCCCCCTGSILISWLKVDVISRFTRCIRSCTIAAAITITVNCRHARLLLCYEPSLPDSNK